MFGLQNRIFKSSKLIAILMVVVLLSVINLGLSSLHEHITQTVLQNMQKINDNTLLGLHRKLNEEVVSATQIIENERIKAALIDALKHKEISERQRFRLRILIASSIFTQQYSGFCLIGKDRNIIVSMKERDTNAAIPAAALLAIKRLEKGEPSVVTHPFYYHGHVVMWLFKPVRNFQGKMDGYFALELGLGHEFSSITSILGKSLDTGETYLVDEQGWMLSESRFTEKLKDIGLLKEHQFSVLNVMVTNPKVNLTTHSKSMVKNIDFPLTLPVQDVLKTHASGWNIDGYRDYRGVQSIGVWQWDDYINAAIITEMDQSEALSDYVYVRNLLLFMLLLVLVASFIFIMEHSRLRIRLNREQHRHKNLLLESTAEAICGLDLHGQCTFVNTSFVAKLGYQEEELLGKKLHAIIHDAYPDGADYPEENCRIAIAQAQRVRVHESHESFWHKDGREIPVEYWVKPLFDQGTLIGSVVSFVARAALSESNKSDAGNSIAMLKKVNDTQIQPPQKKLAKAGEDNSDTLPASEKKVLVVDDEESIVQLTFMRLKNLGIDAITASDGLEALSIYQERHEEISCVITDLTMPRMGGKELLIQIKEINPACPVIICSGYSKEELPQHMLREDVSDFLGKPFSSADFKNAIKKALGREV